MAKSFGIEIDKDVVRRVLAARLARLAGDV
jgi:hypothetical protein